LTPTKTVNDIINNEMAWKSAWDECEVRMRCLVRWIKGTADVKGCGL
jgi:hypothetical protein